MEVSHFKVSTHVFEKYHFSIKCCSVWMKCCSYNFYIIDGHLWSLQCSIVIHTEFVHHIYLLKVDGSLSFDSFNLYFQKVPFLDQVLQCVNEMLQLKFLHNSWPFMVTTVFNCDTCRVFTPYLFTKGRWRSLILKFQLIFSKSTIFGWSVAVLEWNAAVIIFT